MITEEELEKTLESLYDQIQAKLKRGMEEPETRALQLLVSVLELVKLGHLITAYSTLYQVIKHYQKTLKGYGHLIAQIRGVLQFQLDETYT